MPQDKNHELASIFSEMSLMLDILGENAFPIRSYENIARIFENLDHDAAELLDSGELEKIKGIGESTIAKVKEYLESGTIKAHDDLRKKLPDGLLALLNIP